ncbi:MAG: thioesterase family protein [Reichenbachiella sp.]
MIYYWYTILKILILKNFQQRIAYDQTIRRTFRVGIFDCDGLRVMTASKYPVYMDFLRWELIARSKYLKIFINRGLAPALGSQKIIYRKPLKIWTKFDVVLKSVGTDEKWIYHVHYFEQKKEIKAMGITRAVPWKKDVTVSVPDLVKQLGASEIIEPPSWVLKLFDDDNEIMAKFRT